MTTTSLTIGVLGAAGRMGRRIVELAESDPHLSPRIRRVVALPRGAVELDGADVLIDFSSPAGTLHAAELAASRGCALLVGTTGLGDPHRRALASLAQSRAVLVAPNTSLGVAVLRRALRVAAAMLDGFDVDIVEVHHARKKDAPSGTALALAEAIESAGRPLPPERIHAIRAGDVIGAHAVQFAGPGETLRFSHDAVSRDLFALGALRGALWLASRPPGLYSMDDVVGVSDAPETR